jgi:hypothetical protein
VKQAECIHSIIQLFHSGIKKRTTNTEITVYTEKHMGRGSSWGSRKRISLSLYPDSIFIRQKMLNVLSLIHNNLYQSSSRILVVTYKCDTSQTLFICFSYAFLDYFILLRQDIKEKNAANKSYILFQ